MWGGPEIFSVSVWPRTTVTLETFFTKEGNSEIALRD